MPLELKLAFCEWVALPPRVSRFDGVISMFGTSIWYFGIDCNQLVLGNWVICIH